ncbi:hypothetical protein [Dyadobacter bucti]|jgi:hypothetical protein|uniref:hypothetical protein n=1 Tax=Dyadobacter bucti TaxID=2572203 RepID=UPI0011097E4D|nr:hypothetical protein [Dyadobacter bucti]
MKKSNIFAYIELNKLVQELAPNVSISLKNCLKSQSAYFSIIEPKYFSDELMNEWNEILSILKYNGPTLSKEGIVNYNVISTVIENLTDEQCEDIADRVLVLHGKLVQEFKVG